MAVSIALAAVGAGLAIYGAVKKGQAEKKAKQNLANRPVYNPLPEDDSELNLATSQANQGMGAGARQQLQNNTDRNLATTANAALMGGADPNTIGGIVDKSQNAYNNNALYDDQARQSHLNNLQRTYSLYNAQRRGDTDKQYQVNQYGPWADRQQLYSSQVAGGQQTMNSGINMFTSAATGYLNSKKKSGDIDTVDYGTGSDTQMDHDPMDVSWRQGYGDNVVSPSAGAPYSTGGQLGGGDSDWKGYYQPSEFGMNKPVGMVPYYQNT